MDTSFSLPRAACVKQSIDEKERTISPPTKFLTTMARRIECPRCYGDGVIKVHPDSEGSEVVKSQCPNCLGKGQIVVKDDG